MPTENEKFTLKEVTCPYCGKKFEIKAWNSVNLSSEPEAESEILGEHFFNNVCPDCGKKTEFLYPCLIHNAEKEYMIWLIPEGTGDDVKIINSVYTGLDKEAKYTALGTFHDDLKYTNLRCVYTLPELREKLRLNDDKLDDRVMEIVKLLLLAEIVTDKKYECDLKSLMFYTGTSEQDGIKRLNFTLRSGDSLVSFSVSNDIYDKTRANYADLIPVKTREFLTVNRAWAMMRI